MRKHIVVHSYMDEDYVAYMLYVPSGVRGRRAEITGKAFMHYRGELRRSDTPSRVGWIMYDSTVERIVRKDSKAREIAPWI